MNSNSSFFVMMGAMLIIWYFLLIRPQQQRAKKHKEMINNLRKGDRVITQGGIFAKVASIGGDEREIELEIANGVKIKVVRSTIQTVLDKSEPANANAAPKKAANKAKPAEKAAAKPAKAKTAKAKANDK